MKKINPEEWREKVRNYKNDVNLNYEYFEFFVKKIKSEGLNITRFEGNFMKPDSLKFFTDSYSLMNAFEIIDEIKSNKSYFKEFDKVLNVYTKVPLNNFNKGESNLIKVILDNNLINTKFGNLIFNVSIDDGSANDYYPSKSRWLKKVNYGNDFPEILRFYEKKGVSIELLKKIKSEYRELKQTFPEGVEQLEYDFGSHRLGEYLESFQKRGVKKK